MAEKDTSIEEHVARKALDGLFLMIAEEERAIGRDPAKQAQLPRLQEVSFL